MEWTTILSIIVPVLVAIIAAVPGIKALKAQQAERDANAKKLEDDITDKVLGRAKAAIDELSDEVTNLKGIINELKLENESLHRENLKLKSRLRRLENGNGGNTNDEP